MATKRATARTPRAARVSKPATRGSVAIDTVPLPERLAELDDRLHRIEHALLARIPHVFDPPPDDIGRLGGWLLQRPIRWPDPGDPVPIDISRLTKAQLEVSLQSIKAQQIRLEAMETMIAQQMKKVR